MMLKSELLAVQAAKLADSARQLTLEAAYHRFRENGSQRRNMSRGAPDPNLRWVTYRGKTQLLGYFADELDLPRATVYARVRRGWSVEKALEAPVRRYRRIR